LRYRTCGYKGKREEKITDCASKAMQSEKGLKGRGEKKITLVVSGTTDREKPRAETKEGGDYCPSNKGRGDGREGGMTFRKTPPEENASAVK